MILCHKLKRPGVFAFKMGRSNVCDEFLVFAKNHHFPKNHHFWPFSPFLAIFPIFGFFPIFNHFPQNPKIHYFLQFPCFPKKHHFFGILPIFLFFIILSIFFRNRDILYPNKKMIIFLFCQKISFFIFCPYLYFLAFLNILKNTNTSIYCFLMFFPVFSPVL